MAAKILVIEDNPDNLELVCYLLRAFGHQPVAAASGHSGLASAERERPDLILCDLQLPDIDGYEVARRLRNHPELKSVPVVAVTAFAMPADRERVLASGFDGYIAKPIAPEQFVPQIEAFLPRELRPRF